MNAFSISGPFSDFRLPGRVDEVHLQWVLGMESNHHFQDMNLTSYRYSTKQYAVTAPTGKMAGAVCNSPPKLHRTYRNPDVYHRISRTCTLGMTLAWGSGGMSHQGDRIAVKMTIIIFSNPL